MKNFNNQTGSVLLIIILTLIVAGVSTAVLCPDLLKSLTQNKGGEVLTSLLNALPNPMANVAKSRSVEAFASLSTYKTQTEGCVQLHPGTIATSCTWTALNLNASVGNFSYTYAISPSQTGVYAIKATNDPNGNDTITMSKDNVSGLYTCTGAGNYAGLC